MRCVKRPVSMTGPGQCGLGSSDFLTFLVTGAAVAPEDDVRLSVLVRLTAIAARTTRYEHRTWIDYALLALMSCWRSPAGSGQEKHSISRAIISI
jgi:hypothetical protein